MSEQTTIDVTTAFPEHDGRCDLEEAGCRNPVRFIKLAASVPDLWLPGAPVASVGFYCSREHADREPTATREDAERMAEAAEGSDARQAWQALLGSYPEPVEANTGVTSPGEDVSRLAEALASEYVDRIVAEGRAVEVEPGVYQWLNS